MKDLAIKVSHIPYLDAVQCSMSTEDYDIWQQEEGKIVTALSEEVMHGDVVTIIILSAYWFEICKKYFRTR